MGAYLFSLYAMPRIFPQFTIRNFRSPQMVLRAYPFIGNDHSAINDWIESITMDDVPRLAPFTLRGTPDEKRIVISAIGHSDDPRAVPYLVPALLDPEPYVRLEALGAISMAGGDLVREFYEKAKSDADPLVRASADQYFQRHP